MNDKDVFFRQLMQRIESLLEQNRLLVQQNEKVKVNNSELAIRFTVIDRNVTIGTRNDAGIRFCERQRTFVDT